MEKRQAVEIDASDLASLHKALETIAKRADAELDKGAKKAASGLAARARGKLASSSKWGRLVAPSIRATAGGTPGLIAGGSGQFRAARSPGDDPSYGALLFGAEYGMKDTTLWPGHRWKGSGDGAGYGIWPSVSDGSRQLYSDWTDDYLDMADRVWSHRS